MKKNKFIFLIILIICKIVYSDDWNLKLSEGIKERNIEKVKEALKNGANPNEKGSLNYHPLIWATMDGQTETFKILLENGADINVKIERANFGLLYISAMYGRKEICEILIEKGLDINEKDNEGRTPLMAASTFGNIEVVKLLIKKGADIKAKDEEGETAIFKAAKAGKLEICEILISKGLYANEKNKYGKNVLTAAISGRGDYKTIEFLINKGADVNARSGLEWTPLMYAAEKGDLEIVKLLVKKGADINAVSRMGIESAIKIAKQRSWNSKKHTKVYEYLKSIGAKE